MWGKEKTNPDFHTQAHKPQHMNTHMCARTHTLKMKNFKNHKKPQIFKSSTPTWITLTGFSGGPGGSCHPLMLVPGIFLRCFLPWPGCQPQSDQHGTQTPATQCSRAASSNLLTAKPDAKVCQLSEHPCAVSLGTKDTEEIGGWVNCPKSHSWQPSWSSNLGLSGSRTGALNHAAVGSLPPPTCIRFPLGLCLLIVGRMPGLR